MSLLLNVKPGHSILVRRARTLPEEAYVCDREGRDIQAVNAAWAARRALLIKGDPGTGKSLLAHAVAKMLGVPCISAVVDARTEARDLRYVFDAVGRLAAAQVAGHQPDGDVPQISGFVEPGPLWWAFNWVTAQTKARNNRERPKRWNPETGGGCVLLIDEIDKADPSVPNGLLEALGDGCFTPLGQTEPVSVLEGKEPLVILTTNEERTLPDAFVRRCFVHTLKFPATSEELASRASKHFRVGSDPKVFRKAAEMLLTARAGTGPSDPAPGQAEYLDLLRAVIRMHNKDIPKQLGMLDELARYTYGKYSGK